MATYPRTDSQYITADMQATVGSLALWLWQNMPFGKDSTTAPELEGIIDDSKVTDHHAILPTVEMARTDLSSLPAGERDVLMLLPLPAAFSVLPPSPTALRRCWQF